MPVLFYPLQVKNVRLKNRIVVSPMCQYSSKDGYANDWHLVHLGCRATGGAGLVMTEACAVSPEGRISPLDLGIWKDEHIGFLKRIVQFIHEQGSVSGIQLAHAGRKASVTAPWDGNHLIKEEDGGWQTVAPSAIPFSEQYGTPRSLLQEQILQIITDFKTAARRSESAGFRVIEIHAAHGYLIHQFLSPLTNKRQDEYGGSFENRSRLLIEIVRGIRNILPDHPLFVRISATDWAEGGLTLNDSIQLAATLKSNDVDLIDCSSGGIVSYAKIPVGPSYQVSFAEEIRKSTGILTGAVGLITDAHQAESILVTGQADVILFARELLRHPYFPLHAANELRFKEMSWPLQYERAKRD